MPLCQLYVVILVVKNNKKNNSFWCSPGSWCWQPAASAWTKRKYKKAAMLFQWQYDYCYIGIQTTSGAPIKTFAHTPLAALPCITESPKHPYPYAGETTRGWTSAKFPFLTMQALAKSWLNWLDKHSLESAESRKVLAFHSVCVSWLSYIEYGSDTG